MVSDIELTLRIVVAIALGGAIGLERELTGQVAGLRTHITVALGAALFGIVSAYSFTEFIEPRSETNYQVDVTRIASNVVTGVGFLGGGAILKHGASVRGLTTAASMWVTAAVGLAVGLGGYFQAVLSTGLLIAALTVLRRPRRWIRRLAMTKELVVINLADGADAGEVIRALQATPGIDINAITLRSSDGGGAVIEADVKGTEVGPRLAGLAERDDVIDVDFA
ncbi:MAG: MgtC/SapB family protein [Acidimicrobiia bacterium]